MERRGDANGREQPGRDVADGGADAGGGPPGWPVLLMIPPMPCTPVVGGLGRVGSGVPKPEAAA